MSNDLKDANAQIARYNLIALLAAKMENNVPQFGKTILQKTVYLLQELFGLETHYDFEFRNFGPYSDDLAFDLECARALGFVQVTEEQNGVRITPKIKIQNKNALLKHVEAIIPNFVKFSKSNNAKDLELKSTIIFLDRDLKQRYAAKPFSRSKFIEMVQELKPKFNDKSIANEVDKLFLDKYIIITD